MRAAPRGAALDALMPFDKLLFVKRQTYHSSHFYTDFIDGCGRFGLHFGAKKVVFDWKKSPREGFRIYEIDIDPARGIRTGGPRQLTFPPPDEQAISTVCPVPMKDR